MASSAILFGTACSDDGGDGPGFQIGDDLVITVAPNPVTFGTVVVNSHAEQVVTIRHAGDNGTLKLKRVWLDSESGDLSVTQPGLTELAVGESTTLMVNYDPTDTNRDSGVLMIETNVAAAGGALTVEVPIETLSQAGTLQVIPDPVNFDEVESQQVATKNVSYINIGADEVKVTGISIQAGNDGDFSIVSAPEPDTYAHNDNFSVQVAYSPTNGGADTGSLTVEYEVQGEAKYVETLLKGREVGPKLVAFPNPVDFGWQTIDVPVERPLAISNQGSRDLRITSIHLTEDSSDTVEIIGAPTEETVVEPASSDVFTFTVRFTPRSDMVQTTGPIATLIVSSNDSQEGGEYPIYVFGRAEAPVLQVNPPSSVDFGFVAQNLGIQRNVALYNAGSADLQVDGISLSDNPTGEFRIKTDSSWGPLSDPPTAGVLAPGEYREVKLVFTNEGAPTGTQFGKLLVESNDGQRPAWEVDLKAQRTDSATCEVTVVPSELDFGIVPRGFKKTLKASLVNTGSGECSFHSALVNDCASFVGFFGGSCDDPNNTPQQSGNSQYYRVTQTPPAIQNGLKPGQAYDIEITFTPPDSAPIFGDELVDYGALLGIRYIDPYSGTTTPVLWPQAQTGGLSPYTPNLHAKSGVANLAVLPQEVDFGTITIGCHSQTITVTAYNIGTAPLDVTNVELQGCSPEFQIKASPGLPLTLDPNGSAEVKVVYVPQDPGGDSCGLAFYTDTDTPTVVVPLDGAGTYESEQTDEFVQTAGTQVDVLFVVDNSGSMGEEQSNLASNFDTFIQGAQTWSIDYQIGVTTTDMDAEAGRLVGSPRFVNNTDWQDFKNNVKVGSNGSGTEQGLAAAQAALSLPLTSNSTISCTVDEDCTAPDRCYDGFCGGTNRAFVRQDAALEVVFVSDEEDSSPADLNFYINFFKNIKGFYNDNLFHAHAIVGPPGGCSSSAGDAAAGLRYRDVAQATGGSVGSICDSSFAQSLSGIGNIAFGLRKQFFLTRLADPNTVEVTVAGAGCMSNGGSNWLYDAPSNSVIFNESGGCMPQVDQHISIYYETLCLLE